MKLKLLALSFLISTLASVSSAEAEPATTASKGAELRRSELRAAVDAHRASKVNAKRAEAEAKQGEAAASGGRRLTPAELAELRQQVREQWLPPRQEVVRAESPPSAESQPAERVVPAPAVNESAKMAGPSVARP